MTLAEVCRPIHGMICWPQFPQRIGDWPNSISCIHHQDVYCRLSPRSVGWGLVIAGEGGFIPFRLCCFWLLRGYSSSVPGTVGKWFIITDLESADSMLPRRRG